MSAVALAAAVAWSCSPGSDKGKPASPGDETAKNPEPGSEPTKPDGDGLEPTLPVPMGLLDAQLITGYLQKSQAETADAPSVDDFPTVDLGGQVAGEFADKLNELLGTLDVLVGKDGFFGAGPVTIPQSQKGGAVFLVNAAAGAGAPKYAIVRVKDGEALPYRLEAYDQGTAGDPRQLLAIDFGPAEGADESHARWAVVQYTYSNDARVAFVGTVDTLRQTIDADFGMDPPPTTAASPQKNRVLMELTADGYDISGARSFVGQSTPKAKYEFAAGPRYNSSQHADGDVTIFRSSSAAGREVRQSAFLPGDVFPGYAADPVKGFADHPFVQYADAFIAGILRTQLINASCATTGATLRAAGPAGAPELSALPDDVCASNGAVTDAAVVAAVGAVCVPGKALTLTLKLAASTATPSPTAYDVCNGYAQNVRKFAPPIIYTGSTRVDPSAYTSEDLARYDALTKRTTFPGLSGILQASWPKPESVPLSTFDGARDHL